MLDFAFQRVWSDQQIEIETDATYLWFATTFNFSVASSRIDTVSLYLKFGKILN
jgi:hypothetical protein